MLMVQSSVCHCMFAGYVLTWFLAKPEQFASFSHIIIDEAPGGWLCSYHSHFCQVFYDVLTCSYYFDLFCLSELHVTSRHSSTGSSYRTPGPWARSRHGIVLAPDQAVDVFFSTTEGTVFSFISQSSLRAEGFQVILMSATMQPEEFSNSASWQLLELELIRHDSTMCQVSSSWGSYFSDFEVGEPLAVWVPQDIKISHCIESVNAFDCSLSSQKSQKRFPIDSFDMLWQRDYSLPFKCLWTGRGEHSLCKSSFWTNRIWDFTTVVSSSMHRNKMNVLLRFINTVIKLFRLQQFARFIQIHFFWTWNTSWSWIWTCVLGLSCETFQAWQAIA